MKKKRIINMKKKRINVRRHLRRTNNGPKIVKKHTRSQPKIKQHSCSCSKKKPCTCKEKCTCKSKKLHQPFWQTEEDLKQYLRDERYLVKSGDEFYIDGWGTYIMMADGSIKRWETEPDVKYEQTLTLVDPDAFTEEDVVSILRERDYLTQSGDVVKVPGKGKYIMMVDGSIKKYEDWWQLTNGGS
jgi:hypothetical protein